MRVVQMASTLLSLSILVLPVPALAQSIDELVQQATQAQSVGKYEQAEQLWRQVLTLDGSNAVAYYNLGDSLFYQGEFSDAIANYQRSIALDSDPQSLADTYLSLGLAYGQLGNYQAQIDSYTQSLQLDPNNALTYYNLSIPLGQLGDVDAAIAALEQSIQLDPTYADAHVWLGIWQRVQGNYSAAIASLEQALELDPGSTWSYVSLGDLYQEQGQLGQAIAHYQQALATPDRSGVIASAHVDAHNGLGLTYLAQGDPAAAIDEFEAALQLDPGNAETQEYLLRARQQASGQRPAF